MDDTSVTKKGTWTAEEDSKLVAYVTRYGHWNWRQLPKFAGLARCGKSCRLRWLNYLKPGIKRGNYTQQEDETIIKLHRELGNRWSKIAAHLPGRTDNEIKNHWHAKLKKRLQVQQKPHNNSTLGKAKVFKPTEDQNQSPHESRQEIRDSVTNSASSPSQCKSSEVANSQISNTFPVSCTDTGAYSGSDENLAVEDYYDDLAFLDTFIEPISENFWTEPYMVDNSDASVPLSTEPNQYSSPVWDEQLWGHNNQYSSPVWDEQLWGHNN